MDETQFDERGLLGPPLKLPEEVWASLEPRRRRIYLVGQAIIDELVQIGSLPLQDLIAKLRVPPGQFLGALQLLHSMDLVVMDTGESPTLTLLALPDEHVKVTGVDGKQRWVFIARPVEAPKHEPGELN